MDMSETESGNNRLDSTADDDYTIVWCLTKLYQLTAGACLRSWCRLPLRFCQRYLCCKNLPYDDEHEMSDIASDDETTPLCADDHWKKKARIEKVDARIKERLRHQFQDHVHKWVHHKHPRFPWKLALHLLLVGLVTAQVCIFATDKYELMSFLNQNRETFENYFIRKECNAAISTLYTLYDVYEQIEHTVNSYYNISQQGVNAFQFIEDGDIVKNATQLVMEIDYDICQCGADEKDTFPCDDTICGSKYYIPICSYDASNGSSSSLKKPCCNTTNDCNSTANNCSNSDGSCTIIEQIECYINGNNIQRVLNINFDFKLFMSYQKHIVEDYNRVNVTFRIAINFVNKMYNNLMLDVEATTPELKRDCKHEFWNRRKTTIVDAFVLLLLLLSFWTYILSIFKTSMLAKQVKLHFLAYHEKHLRWRELSPLYNKWYILMLFTNLLIFLATMIKIYSDYTPDINIELLETTGLLLGIGILLLWCGLFGLLKHFESLHVILITVELAIPSILRFAIYISILFVAFSLCGWVLLGSFHSKFEGPLVTAVSLYCILNGDDLYDTFNKIDTQSVAVNLFSKVYLCTFMFLFIYIILSLFIGIFNHAYESLSKNWRQRSRGFLRDWVEGEQITDPTKNYPFPIPRVRKPPIYPVIDSHINDHSGDSSLTGSTVSIHETPTIATDVPVIQVTDPADHRTHLSINAIGQRARASSDSNLLAPQEHEGRNWLGSSFEPNAATAHRHRTHSFHDHSGPHLMLCQQHSAKALVADPPQAKRREIARARCKLWASNPHLHHDAEESDA